MTTHLSDLINSFGFELVSCLFLSLNIYSLYRDKIVKGMSVLSMAVLQLMGDMERVWFYYYSINQSWSYYIGVAVAILTTWWTVQAIWYCHKNKSKV